MLATFQIFFFYSFFHIFLLLLLLFTLLPFNIYAREALNDALSIRGK